MGRRKLGTEERQAKQKEKLEVQSATKTEFVRKPSLKEEACELAQKSGFKCSLESNVLVFLYDKYDEKYVESIQKWLDENFGRTIVKENPFYEEGKDSEKTLKFREIPFSYGFKKDLHTFTKDVPVATLDEEEMDR